MNTLSILVSVFILSTCSAANIDRSMRLVEQRLDTTLSDEHLALFQRLMDQTSPTNQYSALKELCPSLDDIQRRYTAEEIPIEVNPASSNPEDILTEVNNLYNDYKTLPTVSNGFSALRGLCKLIPSRTKRFSGSCMAVAAGGMGVVAGTISGAMLGSIPAPGIGTVAGAAAGFATGFASGALTGAATLGQMC